jgi:uncharacterized protein (DUF1800 family)
MSEAPPEAAPGSYAGGTAPPTLLSTGSGGPHDTIPVRFARFDQEHPTGAVDTVPVPAGPAPDGDPGDGRHPGGTAPAATGPPSDPAGPVDPAHPVDADGSVDPTDPVGAAGPGDGATGEPAGEPASDDWEISRNHVLVVLGAAGLATAAGAVLVLADSASSPSPPLLPATGVEPGGRAPATGAAVPGAALRLPRNLDTDLLVRRVSYGATPGMVEAVERMGAQEWLARQLDPASLKDPGGDELRRRFPDLGRDPAAIRERLRPGSAKVMTDLGAAHVGRAVWSSRQLLEVMVDFWSNHLNVPSPDARVWDTRHAYDADVVRRHALGRFTDLLAAATFHPAMLAFLDGGVSAGARPNENHARELLELHTVGTDAGYGETDVRGAALLLTGWRVADGVASYDPDRHAVGAVRILEFSHPNTSAADGEAVQRAFLRHLATHPRTARTVARKLAVRFVSDDPPATLVDRLSTIYLDAGTAIVPVLNALFSSPELAAAGGETVRRPFEHLVATTRALEVPLGNGTRGLIDLYRTLEPAGHLPLAWPEPDGYPDVAAAWRSPASALEDLNGTTNLVHGWWPDKLPLPGPGKLLDEPPDDRDAAVEAVSRRVLGRPPQRAERRAAEALLSGTQLPRTFRSGSWEQEETVALVATLLLSSPAHLAR